MSAARAPTLAGLVALAVTVSVAISPCGAQARDADGEGEESKAAVVDGEAPSDDAERWVERVEVRAARPAIDDPTASVTVVDMENAPARAEDLADVLRAVPGARVRDYGGLGRYATVSMRGSTADQVVVMVDGVPQNRALGGAVDLSTIPATQLAEVRVFRGFSPGSLGFGGIGGVVDVRTRRSAPGEGGARVDALAGELETRRVSSAWWQDFGRTGSYRVGFEALSGQGDFTYTDGGFDASSSEDDVETHRRNNRVESASFVARGTWVLGDGRGTSAPDRPNAAGENLDHRSTPRAARLSIGVRTLDRERGIPGLDAVFARRSETLERRRAIDASLTGRVGPVGFDVLADAFRDDLEFRDPLGEIGVGAQLQETRVEGGGVAAVARIGGTRHRGLARFDVGRERARVRDRAIAVRDRGGARRTSGALTLEHTYASGAWRITSNLRGSVRRDRFLDGGVGIEAPADDVDDRELVGRVGAARQLGRRSLLRASIGSYHREPALLELFGDRGAVVGNPSLRAETGDAVELGFEHVRRRDTWDVRVELAGFARRSDDLIVLVPNSQSTAVARNLASAEVLGLEVALDARLPFGLSARMSASALDTEDSSPGPAGGKPIVGVPRRAATVGASFARDRYEIDWELTYTGPNPTDTLDTPSLRLPSRVVHDIAVRIALPRGLTLGVDVRNVFDREVRDVARFPLPGRVALVYLGFGAETRRSP